MRLGMCPFLAAGAGGCVCAVVTSAADFMSPESTVGAAASCIHVGAPGFKVQAVTHTHPTLPCAAWCVLGEQFEKCTTRAAYGVLRSARRAFSGEL
mmetsp:Transcript_20711/g.61854  ORF Transcript_20711/g.61854 Transcript_20711/m.61854 type:complete len:96 (-) Transcript_20711:292-579(-)